METKKKKIVLVLIAIIALILGVVGATYALWLVTETQDDENSIVAACLNISYTNESDEINLTNAWPVSYKDGITSTPYTFRVVNNCDTDIAYKVQLDNMIIEDLDAENYLDYSSIAISYDYFASTTLDKFTVIPAEGSDAETIRNSSFLETKVVEGNTYNDHTLRLWIDKDADVTESRKQYHGKVRLIAGQNIVREEASAECFDFDSVTGTINEFTYGTGCGVTDFNTELVIPRYINGVKVTTIGNGGDVGAYNKVITIPDTVTTISASAFESDHNVERFNLSRGLQHIGDMVFPQSGTLESITIPNTVTTIGDYAIFTINNYFEIPASVTSLGAAPLISNEPLVVRVHKTQTDAQNTLGTSWYEGGSVTIIYDDATINTD